MRLKHVFYRYEILLSIIALLLIGTVSNISRSISIESPVQLYPEVNYSPVALTFDDGPYPEFTEKLLDILDSYNVKATFFVLGRHVKEYPCLIKMISSRGHEIGGHTYAHSNITKLSNKQLVSELQTTQKYIEENTGNKTYLFRPPGGNYNARSMKLLSSLGYTTVLWSVLPRDHESFIKKADIVNCIKEETKPYGIILLHLGRQETLDALPEIIFYLKSKNYRFVTMSEMLKKDKVYVKQYIASNY